MRAAVAFSASSAWGQDGPRTQGTVREPGATRESPRSSPTRACLREILDHSPAAAGPPRDQLDERLEATDQLLLRGIAVLRGIDQPA